MTLDEVVYELETRGEGWKWLHWREVYDCLSKFRDFLHPSPVAIRHWRYMGLPLIPVSDGFVLFLSCEYCRTKDLPTGKNCAKCGAEII